MQRVPTPEQLESSTRSLKVGQLIDSEEVRQWLAQSGFSATSAVQLPGEFAVRGGLLDIYSADQSNPLRIEWFGDEIESIRQFDLASQRSIESLNEIEIAAIGVTAAGETEGAEERSGELGTLRDYLPKDTVVVLVEPDEIRQSAEKLYERSGESSNLLSHEELLESLRGFTVVTVSSLRERADEEETTSLHLETGSTEAFGGSLDETKIKLDELPEHYQVITVGDTAADGERLSELLRDTTAAKNGRLRLLIADITGGFRLTGSGLVVLTGAE